MSRRHDPFIITGDDLPEGEVESPADAPPVLDEPAQVAAMQSAMRVAGRKKSLFAGWFWPLLGSVLTLMIGIAAHDYVTGLIDRYPSLGFVVLVLLCLLALVVLVQIARELISFRKLARIDRFRAAAAQALADADHTAALKLSQDLEGFYSGRPEIRWGQRSLEESRSELLDADAVIGLTERAVFTQLDAMAVREIENAARTVAGATALIPLALADVLTALSMNVRMIRRISEIYGAHSGFFGSWRLMRSVAAHLLATGMVAVGDDMISSFAGGGALSKISRRFGEGVVNGALTARVGIAATEVCRPLPYAALPRPRVSSIMSRSVTGLFPQKGDGEP